MTPDEALASLIAEGIPHGFPRARHDACHDGPTAQWLALEAQRELWALAAAKTDAPASEAVA